VRLTSSVQALVYVTSDKCYENFEWEWGYRENDSLGGRDPYSASKAAAELIFSSYSRSYFENRTSFGAASVRAGNVIGGGDWSLNRIIPDCVRAFQNDGEITLRYPEATRPWQHVLEPLSGYLLLGANLMFNPLKFNGAWNFGPPASQVRTVFEVASTVMEHLQAGHVNIDLDESTFHEAKLLQLNCDRANQLLGWSTRWNIENTLKKTAIWYKEFYSSKPAVEITDAQIHEYFLELK
jgi:CDP-glucose 4,6-dehydratase